MVLKRHLFNRNFVYILTFNPIAMKNQLLLSALVAFTLTAWSQTELDDLYFNGKDRQREYDSRPKVNRNLFQHENLNDAPFGGMAFNNKSGSGEQEFNGNYGGRYMNPDVDPNAEEQLPEDFQYFNPAFSPMVVNHRLSNQYFDPMFPSSGFYNAWNNPYSSLNYNRFYDPFYSPYSSPFGYGFNGFGGGFDPFFGGGCFSCSSSAWSFGFGNSWNRFNYGFNNFGFNNFGYNSFGFNNFGWNNPYWGMGYSSWFRPNTVIINNYDRYPRVTYGRRNSRSTNINNDAQLNIRNRQNAISGTGSRSNQAGRVASGQSNNYYERGWRGNQSSPSKINSGTPRTTTKSSSWNSDRQSDWFSSPSRGSSGFESGVSRSSGFSGGGSRSSSGGSSSGGRRGRN